MTKTPAQLDREIAAFTGAKKVRITMTNNSAASRPGDVSDLIGGHPCRHNGGKLVIATVPASEIDAVRADLDDSHSVKSYDVEE